MTVSLNIKFKVKLSYLEDYRPPDVVRLHVQVELLGAEVAPQLQREHRLRGRGVVQLELQLRLVDVKGAAIPVQR